jgi:hypothetical protein
VHCNISAPRRTDCKIKIAGGKKVLDRLGMMAESAHRIVRTGGIPAASQ